MNYHSYSIARMCCDEYSQSKEKKLWNLRKKCWKPKTRTLYTAFFRNIHQNMYSNEWENQKYHIEIIWNEVMDIIYLKRHDIIIAVFVHVPNLHIIRAKFKWRQSNTHQINGKYIRIYLLWRYRILSAFLYFRSQKLVAITQLWEWLF